MNRIEIPAIGLTQEIASSWSELTPKQSARAMALAWELQRGQLSLLGFQALMLFELLNIKQGFKAAFWERLNPKAAQEKNFNVYRLCKELLSWMTTPTESGYAPSFDTIINPLHMVKSGRRRLYGPADGLCDLTLSEFRNALIAREEFIETQQEEALDRMISFLYRRRGKKPNNGGRWVSDISHTTFETDLRLASQIEPWQKQTILMWFSSCVGFLQTAKLSIAGEVVDMSEIFRSDDGDSLATKTKFSWTDVICELAKENTIGNMDKVDEQGLYYIFLILWHNIKQAKRNAKT